MVFLLVKLGSSFSEYPIFSYNSQKTSFLIRMNFSTSVKRDPNVCVLSRHSKSTHDRCIALMNKHRQHSHKQISKFGQYVYLPESDLEWRNCIVNRFHERTVNQTVQFMHVYVIGRSNHI